MKTCEDWDLKNKRRYIMINDDEFKLHLVIGEDILENRSE